MLQAFVQHETNLVVKKQFGHVAQVLAISARFAPIHLEHAHAFVPVDLIPGWVLERVGVVM